MAIVRSGSGRLDRRITFRIKGETLDALGEPDYDVLTDHCSVAAAVESIGAMERFAGGDEAHNITKFRIRYRDDLHEDMAIEYDGWRYDINGLESDGRRNREWLIVRARRNRKL